MKNVYAYVRVSSFDQNEEWQMVVLKKSMIKKAFEKLPVFVE